MNKKPRFSFLIILIFSSILLIYSSCEKEQEEETGPEATQTEFPDRGFGFVHSTMEELLEVPIADTSVLGNRSNLSLELTFSLYMPPIKSQGNSESSCVAFAAGYAARSYAFHTDNNIIGPYANDNTFSPEYLYNSTKQTGDCKAGSTIIDALSHMKNVGICTWEDLEYSDSNGCDQSGWDPDIYENTGCYKIDSYSRIDVTNVGVMKRWIRYGFPIICGMRIDTSLFWKNWSTRPYYNPSFVWEEQVGEWDTEGHAMVITGWDDSKNAWKVMNSYGDRYGDGGYGWIDYDFLEEALAAWRVLNYSHYFMFIMHTNELGPGCIEPFRLDMVPGGNNQTGGINTQLPQPLEVLVRDEKGNPLEGVEVNFFVIEGSGTIPQQEELTNQDGIARTYWTLGDLEGEQKLSVSCWNSDYETIIGSPMEFKATGIGGETFMDPRDGQTYKIITIGTQTWFAESLNYDVPGDLGCPSGGYYTWDEAQIACPEGWHLPSDEEWITLESFLGLDPEEFYDSPCRGCSVDLRGQMMDNDGLNLSFSGGMVFNDETLDCNFYSGSWATYWTSTEANETLVWNRDIEWHGSYVSRSRSGKTGGQANEIRCVKD